MSFFEAFNDSGARQFDAESYAYSFVGSGDCSLQDYYNDPDDLGTYQFTYGFATVAYDFDLVFFSGSAAPFWPKNIPNSVISNNPRTIVITGNRVSTTVTNASAAVTFYAFRSMRAFSPAAHGVGMELYNADGTVCYSTLQGKPAKVINNASVVSLPLNWAGSVTIASGNYAWMQYGTLQNGVYVPAIKTRATGWDGSLTNSGLTSRTVTAGGILGIDVSGY